MASTGPFRANFGSRRRSLNYLVGNRKESWWNHQIESFCGLDVDLEKEFGRLLNGLVGRTRSFQDAINVAACHRSIYEEIDRVRHQTPLVRRAAVSVNRRQVTLGSEYDQPRHDAHHKRIVRSVSELAALSGAET